MPLSKILPCACGAVVLLALAGLAFSQQAETPEKLAARIDKLVEQLDDDSFDVREKAQAALVAIGSPALDKVTVAAKDTSVERSQRAASILAVIRRAGVGLRLASQVKHDFLMGAVTLALSPDGQFVYVPAFQTNAVNVFRRNAASGALEHQQSLVDEKQLNGVVKLRLSTDGKHAVAASFRSKSIALFSRDATTGKLTLETVRANEPEGELKLDFPIDAVFSADGKFVYAVDDLRAIVVVFKVVDGKRLELVESFEGKDRCFNGGRTLAASPDGKTLYVASRHPGTLSVLDRDAESGKLAVRQLVRDEEGDVHGLAGANGVFVSADGKFVYSIAGRFEGDNAIGVYQVGPDGKLVMLQEFISEKGDVKDFAGPNELLISPDGLRVYASGTRSCSLACFTRDPASGKLGYVTTLASVGTGKAADLGANGMKISPDGKFLYLALENNAMISVFERGVAEPKP